MFKNVILFPHRAGQLLKGVDKSPKTLSLYLNRRTRRRTRRRRRRLATDIDNCGAGEAGVHVKSDQEPATVALQNKSHEVRRGKPICTKSTPT